MSVAGYQRCESTRNQMKGYWQNYQPVLESMMLDTNARELHREEHDEILSMLPDLTGKDVLELGAGIGRFTGDLARASHHVTAVDFMQEYITENRKHHGSLGNVDFICADVLEMTLHRRYDMIFSNWLLMYLNDEECLRLLQKALASLKEDGYLFIRESCYRPSGNSPRASNPTFYRTPASYNALLAAARFTPATALQEELCTSTKTPVSWGFDVIRVLTVKTYVKHKNNPYQLCFLAKKMSLPAEVHYNSMQEFLDKQQYSKSGVRRYEWIFGETFLSTGGLKTTQDIVHLLNLKPGEHVLDVGCGLGGHDFYMAETFGVSVYGVDLSLNMMSVALEHLSKRPHLTSKVRFEIRDITTAQLDAASFDAVYSRDTFLHIGNKETLFEKFYDWLKPGGRILFTDYGRGDRDHGMDFQKYIAQRGYHLLTVDQYHQMLKKVGFVNVKAEDWTQQFIDALERELKRLQNKDEFLKEFSKVDYEEMLSGWQGKITRAQEGDQVWILCYAQKPSP